MSTVPRSGANSSGEASSGSDELLHVSTRGATSEPSADASATSAVVDIDGDAGSSAEAVKSVGDEVETQPDQTGHDSCEPDAYWDDTDNSCQPWSTCAEGEFVVAAGTAESDRVCSDCPSQTYSTEPNVAECTACNTCGWLGLETACTNSRDATCRDINVTKQFGTGGYDIGKSVAVDRVGDVWVAGFSDDFAYHQYAVVRRYPATGAEPVDYELDRVGLDSANAVSADTKGNVWVGGHFGGVAFLSRFTLDDAEPVTTKFGTGSDAAVNGIAIGESQVWAVGDVQGDLGGPSLGGSDAFLYKLPLDGFVATILQFGTEGHDVASGVAVDSKGDVWVVGSTDGDLAGNNEGFNDVFLRRYPADGSVPMTYQFGTPAVDVANAIVIDTADNIWLAGTTGGDFVTGTASTRTDAFVLKYSPGQGETIYQSETAAVSEDGRAIALARGAVLVSGTKDGDGFVWSEPDGTAAADFVFGTSQSDSVLGVTSDQWGNVWVVGSTAGAFVGNNKGSQDIFVRQIAR
jgi:TNFR/NGFR cysteine-rich region/Beta-propeller repeat